MKTCKKCLIIKPYDDFSVCPATRDRYAPWCKKCFSENYKRYRLLHMEDIKAKKAIYDKNRTTEQRVRTNRKAILRRKARYKVDPIFREKIRKIARNWYAKRKQEALAKLAEIEAAKLNNLCTASNPTEKSFSKTVRGSITRS